MKIKIIDILNKIANGEEPPKKIVYDGFVYIYDESQKDYKHIGLNDWLLDDYILTDILNDEVEILETTITYKPDKIEKLNLDIFNDRPFVGKDEIMAEKINEIIDHINSR